MAKRSRSKGMKRAYLKRFSQAYINTGRSLNKIGMEALFSGSKLPLNSDPFLSVLFGPDTNKGGLERQKALELRDKILQGDDPRLHVKLVETAKYRVLLHYTKVNEVEMHCYLVKVDKSSSVVHKSITYGSKARAMQALKMDKVVWVIVPT